MAHTTMQHLKVREMHICVRCGRPKEVGLVLCPSCVTHQNDATMRYLFDMIEIGLIGLNAEGKLAITGRAK